ncbi:hypothetical protein GCM10016455_13800 [Aliiroseovarius zhejiangensis]|uniref:Cold shock domain-containing protein n=1 Tax=Aliiroseovarius zhejiangensis TaxID=1632025 RepID=A0ABQ3IUN8_9RHOB|nr:hypothetical protein [Aliiroseovarius zhejiangensis]GHE94583.1 hypothetical protein GCM10016455_13800 [Aliiroseovarius zhejiangensis]
MLGIILWYNADKSVGMVWCEDQGPLAFIGPEIVAPEGVGKLQRGSQIWFDFDEANGFRMVSRIEAVGVIMGGIDPAQVLSSFGRSEQDGQDPDRVEFDGADTRPALRVVA